MKKIKGILLFGILTLLGIGSSFATNNSLSVFHVYNQSNALLISTHSSRRSGVYLANRLSTYFDGGQQNTNLWNSFGNFNSFSSLSTSSWYFPFSLSINNGSGFYLSGSYLNGSGDWVDFSLINNSFAQELGNYSINYNSGEDFWPLVFDEYYNYFSLADNEIIFNGTPYGSFNFGTLEYCLYGINRDFSCVYTTTTGINFVHFTYNTSDEYGYYFTGYLLQPLNILTSTNDFTGTGSLIISLDSQDRLIYNIIDVYSDNPVSLSAGNVIDKGFIDIGSVSFSHRYFLGNNVFGNFSEIYNSDGIYYFRSNIINHYTSNTTTNRSYCDYYPSSCLSSTGLVFVSDENVINIPLLGNGGNGNQQSTGSIAINTGLIDQCLNDLEFGDLNYYLCSQLFGNIGFPIQIPGTSGQYISVSVDENGNIRYRITTQNDLEEQMSGFIWVENEDGSWSTVCPDGVVCGSDTLFWDGYGANVTTGLSDLPDKGFFGQYLEDGLLFTCPFSSSRSKKLFEVGLSTFISNLGQDVFYPIYCQIDGFKAGKNTIIFGTGQNLLESRFMSSSDYTMFYYFFDILLSIGIVLLLFKLYHLIN